MEFHITMFSPITDLGAIEHAISAIDPSALVDTDTSTLTLRVAASVDAGHLVALMGQAGYPIGLQQVVQIPSVCCGGCSG
jgi:hypothetical protein